MSQRIEDFDERMAGLGLTGKLKQKKKKEVATVDQSVQIVIDNSREIYESQ